MLIKEGTVLVQEDGNHFTGLLPTAFLLLSSNYPLAYIKDYIDERHRNGAKGFRVLLNCWWGPSQQGEHGGNTAWKYNAQALELRIAEVCQYCKQKDMYLFIAQKDASSAIFLGDEYYEETNMWRDQLYYMIDLHNTYSNIVVELGNETTKGRDLHRETIWEKWAISFFKTYAPNLLIAAEINHGTGVPELAYHPDVDIISVKTPRTDGPSVVEETYTFIRDLRLKYQNKVIWYHEPPRRNYPYTGAWCSETHKEYLRAIMYGSIGCLYTPHGLGSGQEENKPPDGYFLWGVGDQDFVDLWEGYNKFVSLFKRPPAGPNAKQFFDFIPYTSWFTGAGFGYKSKGNYVCYPIGEWIRSQLVGRYKFYMIDKLTGEVKVETTIDNPGSIQNIDNKIMYFRKMNATEVVKEYMKGFFSGLVLWR